MKCSAQAPVYLSFSGQPVDGKPRRPPRVRPHQQRALLLLPAQDPQAATQPRDVAHRPSE